MPEKPGKNREQLKEITDRIEAGIRDIFESGDMEKYRNYLRTMSRFHNYSLNNQALIHLQRPDATLVAGYNRWRDKFSRHVLRGEKGITIIAPTPYKKKIEQEKLDPDTKLPILDADGKIVTEEKEIEIPMFRPVKVFDYAQTDGKPLPERVASPVANLTGSVENYEAFMEALRRSSPVPVEFKPLSADMDGYFSPKSQSITLREGMSEVQTVSAAVHEIAHAKLHNYGLQQAAERKAKSRNTEEVEAESISFMVCAYFGIETGANSFGYVATWSKNAELPEFRASLDTISKTANGIITDVEKHFAEVCKERGIELPKDTEYELVTLPRRRAGLRRRLRGVPAQGFERARKRRKTHSGGGGGQAACRRGRRAAEGAGGFRQAGRRDRHRRRLSWASGTLQRPVPSGMAGKGGAAAGG